MRVTIKVPKTAPCEDCAGAGDGAGGFDPDSSSCISSPSGIAWVNADVNNVVINTDIPDEQLDLEPFNSDEGVTPARPWTSADNTFLEPTLETIVLDNILVLGRAVAGVKGKICKSAEIVWTVTPPPGWQYFRTPLSIYGYLDRLVIVVSQDFSPPWGGIYTVSCTVDGVAQNEITFTLREP